MLNQIMSNTNGWLIITKQSYSSVILYLRSSSTIFIHNNSQTPCVIARNSMSALNQATTFGFLLLHVTRFPPRIIQYQDVNFVNNWTCIIWSTTRSPFLLKSNPLHRVVLRHQDTIHNLQVSHLWVMHKLANHTNRISLSPASYVLSISTSLSTSNNEVYQIWGFLHHSLFHDFVQWEHLWPNIRVSLRRSRTYFHWEMKMPCLE